MSKMSKTIAQSFKMTKCLQIRKEKANCQKQYAKPMARGESSRIPQMPETPKPKGKFLNDTVLSLSRNKRKSPDNTPENKTLSTLMSVSPILKQSPRSDITWRLSSPTSVQEMTQTSEPCRYVPDRVEKTADKKTPKTLINVWKTKKQIGQQTSPGDPNNSSSFKRPRLGNDERCNRLTLSQIIAKPGFNPRQKPDFTIFDDTEWPDEDEFQNPEFLKATQEMENVICQSVKTNQAVQRKCVSHIEPKSTRGVVQSRSSSERISIAPSAGCGIMKTSQLVKKSTLNETANFTEIRRKSQQCTQSLECAPLPNLSISSSGSRNLVAQNSFIAKSQAPKGGTIGVQKENKLTLMKPSVNAVAPNTSRTIQPLEEIPHRQLTTLTEKPKPDNSRLDVPNVFDDLMNESFDELLIKYSDLLEGDSSGGSKTVPDQLQRTSAVCSKPETLQSDKVEFDNVGDKFRKEHVGNNQSTTNSANTRNSVEGNFDSKQKLSLSKKPATTSSVQCNAAAKRKEKLAENTFTNIKPKENASNTCNPNRNMSLRTSDERLNMNSSVNVNPVNCSTPGSVWPDDPFFNTPEVLHELEKMDVSTAASNATCSNEAISRKREAAIVIRQTRLANRLMIPR